MWRSTTYLEISALLASYFCMYFNATRTYSVGSECIYEGNYFQCITEHTGDWNNNNWSIIGSPNLPLLLWFDLFNQQFERLRESNAMPFLMPAAFFEFGEIQWVSKSSSNPTQEGNAIFRFYLGLEFYHESYDTSHDQTKKLVNLDYMDYLFEALHLKSGTHFDKLQRITDQTANDYDNVMIHIVEFQTTIYHQIEDNSSFEHTVTSAHINPDYSTTPYKRLTNNTFDNVVLNNAPAE